MRRPLALVLAAVLGATGLSAATAQEDAPRPEVRAAEQLVLEEGADRPAGEADQRYGWVEADPEDPAASEPTVVTESTSLPSPQPGAEVYPRPSSGVWTTTGGGWGHRIGMSQYGAHGAGLAGLTHSQILAFYYPGTIPELTDRTTIRVGITVDNDGVTRVAHRSGLQVGNAPGGATYALPSDRSEWRVRATSSSPSSCTLEGKVGAGWTAYWPAGMTQACPVSFSSPTEGSVDLFLPSGSQRVYRGTVTATHRGTASLLTVNHVPTQQYLYSVVAAEMSPYFHTQALRAQAVAARTYALGGSSGSSHYDTCDTTYCQVYRGKGVRTSGGGISPYEYPETSAGVDATDRQVLSYVFSGGVKRLATTMFSATNGGWTDNGGAGHGYLVAKADPYDDTPINSRHAWTGTLPASSLQARYGIHRVERIQVLTRDGDGAWGGRILTARVEGFTSAGNYAYANASGTGLMLARYWPTYSDGLSSDYFTFGDVAAPPDPEPPAPPPGPEPGEVERLAGANRYETAALLSEHWAPDVSVVYVVSGRDYPDALTASARSGVYDAPVLLTQPTSVPSATREAMLRLSPSRVVVVGGTASVSAAVAEQLRSWTDTGNLQRVAGDDRYETAARMASYYPSGVDRVILASGQTYADALAGSARAGHEQVPLLLARQDRLDAATVTQLQRLSPGEVVVLGSTDSISRAVAEQAASYSRNGTYRRLAGADRYGTAAAIAELYPAGSQTAYVATGQDFPDALVSAALAARRGEPLLLSRGDRLPSTTGTALERTNPVGIVALGGPTVLVPAVLEALEDYLR